MGNSLKDFFQNMLTSYLINRIRVMGPGEVLKRVLEFILDIYRYVFRRHTGATVGEQEFFPPLAPASSARLEALWRRNDWHARALEDLKQGKIEINGVTYRVEGKNPWVRCPDRRRELPMILGRRYLFQRMYAEANMQYIATLNRHYHLVHRAKAAKLGRDDAGAVLAGIRDWIAKNPYLTGINWADSLNVAIRSVNWCLIFGYLGMKKVDGEIADSIHRHGLFIEQHLSFGSSAANHIIGELWGLFFIAHCFPRLPRAEIWRRLAIEGLSRELERQFCDDGFHKERSLSYHRYLLEYLLLIINYAKVNHVELPACFHKVVHNGLRSLGEVINRQGEAPFLGDHGHEITTDIHYLSFWSTDLFQSVLRMGAAIFDDPKLKGLVRDVTPDERMIWVLSEDDILRYERIEPYTPVRTSRRFDCTGLYILRDGQAYGEETSLIVRCGPMGFAPLRAHAHADQLGFVLSVRGKQYLIDPGTYGYHFKGPRWRQYFRGTSAHNTVLVDGKDQAVSGGAMIWLAGADGHLDRWESSNDSDYFEGWHDGYTRVLERPVRHQRTIRLDKAAQEYLITDRIVSETREKITAFLHFHPDVRIRILSNQRLLATRADDSILIQFARGFGVHVHRADDQRPLGWYSPYFGIKYETTTISVEGYLQTGDELTTRIRFLPGLSVEP